MAILNKISSLTIFLEKSKSSYCDIYELYLLTVTPVYIYVCVYVCSYACICSTLFYGLF